MIFYLTGAGAYCTFLIFNLFKDRKCPNTDLTSWIVVALASTLWVVVLPISLIEIRTKIKDKAKIKNSTLSSSYQCMPEPIGITGSFDFDSGTFT